MGTEQTVCLKKMTRGDLGKQCHSSDGGNQVTLGDGGDTADIRTYEPDSTRKHGRGRCWAVEQTHHRSHRRPHGRCRNLEALEEPRGRTCLHVTVAPCLLCVEQARVVPQQQSGDREGLEGGRRWWWSRGGGSEQSFTSGCISKAKWTEFLSGRGDQGRERNKDGSLIFLLSTRKDGVVLPGHGAEGLDSDGHSEESPDAKLGMSAREQSTKV